MHAPGIWGILVLAVIILIGVMIAVTIVMSQRFARRYNSTRNIAGPHGASPGRHLDAQGSRRD